MLPADINFLSIFQRNLTSQSPLRTPKTKQNHWRVFKIQGFRLFNISCSGDASWDPFWKGFGGQVGAKLGQVGIKLAQVGFKLASCEHLQTSYIFIMIFIDFSWIWGPQNLGSAAPELVLWGARKTPFSHINLDKTLGKRHFGHYGVN